jgi:hypothetical protein
LAFLFRLFWFTFPQDLYIIWLSCLGSFGLLFLKTFTLFGFPEKTGKQNNVKVLGESKPKEPK